MYSISCSPVQNERSMTSKNRENWLLRMPSSRSRGILYVDNMCMQRQMNSNGTHIKQACITLSALINNWIRVIYVFTTAKEIRNCASRAWLPQVTTREQWRLFETGVVWRLSRHGKSRYSDITVFRDYVLLSRWIFSA